MASFKTPHKTPHRLIADFHSVPTIASSQRSETTQLRFAPTLFQPFISIMGSRSIIMITGQTQHCVSVTLALLHTHYGNKADGDLMRREERGLGGDGEPISDIIPLQYTVTFANKRDKHKPTPIHGKRWRAGNRACFYLLEFFTRKNKLIKKVGKQPIWLASDL